MAKASQNDGTGSDKTVNGRRRRENMFTTYQGSGQEQVREYDSFDSRRGERARRGPLYSSIGGTTLYEPQDEQRLNSATMMSGSVKQGSQPNRGRPRRPYGTRRDEETSEASMSFQRLQQLGQSNPLDVLQIAVLKRSGFHLLLKRERLENDWITAILAVLHRACLCDNSPHTLRILLQWLSKSNYLTQVLRNYLCDISKPGTLIELETIQGILVVFKTLLKHVSQSFCQVVPQLSIIEAYIKYLKRTKRRITMEIEKALTDAISARDQQMERKARTLRMLNEPDKNEFLDDFRRMSIMPTLEELELTDRPLIRPNKDHGKFTSLLHYLDTQFRLMREDFIAPLREGIQDYKIQVATGEKMEKTQGLRLYKDVRFLKSVCTDRGIAYKIKFDVSKFKHIRWESTKRLIFGSLLCLSADGFTTILFASVSNRELEDLRKGEIQIYIESPVVNTAMTDPNISYLMAETSAFFESYRHVLKTMAEIHEKDLPFQQYIVSCKTHVQPPSYLQRQDVRYSLDTLRTKKMVQPEDMALSYLKTSDKKIVDIVTDDDLDDDFSHDAPDTKLDMPESSSSDESDNELTFASQSYAGSPKGKKPLILDKAKWPTGQQLGLNQSQLKALQTALTKEYAIIQGPPGTGKTYVGLKITEALLDNKDVWSPQLTNLHRNGSPILVVTYTNHALDQFLAGIHQFRKKGIIRVGSRCQDETLQKFSLPALRAQYRKDKMIPNLIRTASWEARQEKEAAEQSLTTAYSLLNETKYALIRESFLEELLPRDQYISLTLHPQYSRHQKDIGSVTVASCLHSWLGLKGKSNDSSQNAETANSDKSKDSPDICIEIQEEADILAQERKLDYESDDEDKNLLDSGKSASSHVSQCNTMLENLCVVNLKAPDEEFSLVSKKKREQKHKLTEYLQSNDQMTRDEAQRVKDVHCLTHDDRWRLYRYWRSLCVQRLERQLQNAQRIYQLAADRYQEARTQEDIVIMQSAEIIGITTTAAARLHNLLKIIGPKIVIVEEAAEVLEAHIITSLTCHCQHLILIGDHKQLRPNPTVYELAKHYRLDISLFERMLNNGMHCRTLAVQHRMRPEISQLLRVIYPNLQDHPSVHEYEDIKGIGSNLFFVDHVELEDTNEDLKSQKNEHEAKFIVSLCRYLLLQGYKHSQITVLTMYTGQLLCLKTHMPKAEFNGIKVTSVDNFQGEENDIVLLSLVRSNVEGKIGFLKTPNRMCVALSRAKMGMYVIGNFTLLSEKSEWWNHVVEILQKQGKIGTGLPLYCQNHPNDAKIYVSKSDDFLQAPDGGCMRICDARLPCGHACTRYCHNDDQNHKNFICRKPCTKALCHLGHPCPQPCFVKCKECRELVTKTLPCGHSAKVECYQGDATHNCIMPCEVVHPCGHACRKRCHEDCGKCEEPVKKVLPMCGHETKVPCHQSEATWTCQEKCKKKFPCGHACENICGQPCKKCQKKCGKKLPCGHICTKPCTSDCGRCEIQVKRTLPNCNHTCQMACYDNPQDVICKERCEKKHGCGHRCGRQCGKKCGSCDVAVLKTLSPCGHKVEQPCHTLRGETIACNRPCEKILSCGHGCNNICSEACGPCNVTVLKIIPECGHVQDVPCSKDPSLIDCEHECTIVLPCGHKCSRSHCYLCKKIFKKCEKCTQKVKTSLSRCKHSLNIPCGQSLNRLDYKCQENCNEILPCGHQCLRQSCCKDVGVECMECPVVVEKIIPSCGHDQRVPCSQDPATFSCQAPCEVILTCGHQCQKKCGDENHTAPAECCEIVTETKPCGHKIRVKCNESNISQPCQKECKAVLLCGHQCTGTCSSCLSRKFHRECMLKCNKILLCGHKCKNLCSEVCSPCTRRCENKCPHKKCNHLCKDPCLPCVQLCVLQCEHFSCTKLCCEPCNKPRCNELCRKKLSCGHPCMGLCGEPCPDVCEVCHTIKQKKTRRSLLRQRKYVQIQECGHIIDVETIDRLMDIFREKLATGTTVALPVCPRCQIPIRDSCRFGDILGQIKQAMEKAKKVAMGDSTNIQSTREHLRSTIGSILPTGNLTSKPLERRNALKHLINIIDTVPQEQLPVIENQINVHRKLLEIYEMVQTGSAEVNLKGIADRVIEGLKAISVVLFPMYRAKVVAVGADTEWKSAERRLPSEHMLEQIQQKLHSLALIWYTSRIGSTEASPSPASQEILHEFNDVVELSDGPDFKPLKSNKYLLRSVEKLIENFITVKEKLSEKYKPVPLCKMARFVQEDWTRCPNGHVFSPRGQLDGKTCIKCVEESGSHATLSNGEEKQQD